MIPPSLRRRPAALALCAALLLTSCATAPAPTPEASTVPSAGPTEVDPDAEVRYLDGDVVTPCFRYRAPDPSWSLVEGSAGCSTGVGPGGDMLSTVQVRAVTVAGTLEELAGMVAAQDPEGTVERVRLAGRDVARAITALEGSDLVVATYVVAYPDAGLTGGGDPISAVLVTALWSAEYEALVEDVVASLTRPGGEPL